MTDETYQQFSHFVSSIKEPIWISGQDDFQTKCLIREFLHKCSDDKIAEMLKSVLSIEEINQLVMIKTEPESEAELVEVDLNNILSSEDILSLVKTEFSAFTNQFDIKDQPQYEQIQFEKNEIEIKEESDFIQPGGFCTNLFVGIKEGPSGLSPRVNKQTEFIQPIQERASLKTNQSDVRTTLNNSRNNCKRKRNENDLDLQIEQEFKMPIEKEDKMSQTDDKNTLNNESSIKVEIYKHAVHQNIRFTCDPITKQLVSKPSEPFLDFWRTSKLTVQELISKKVFAKVCDIIQEKNTDNRPRKTVEMYRHKTHPGVRFTCDPMTKELESNSKSSLQVKDYLRKTKSTIKELIENGLFIKVCDVIMVMDVTNNSKQYVALDLD